MLASFGKFNWLVDLNGLIDSFLFLMNENAF